MFRHLGGAQCRRPGPLPGCYAERVLLNTLAYIFLENLDGVQTASVLFPDKDHTTETTSADDSELLKIINRNFSLTC